MPTAKFSQSRTLPSANSARVALALLHDYEQLIRCQPLVGPTEKLPGAPEAIQAQVAEAEKSPAHTWYQQTEHVPILPFGLLKKKVVFYNWFRDLPDLPSPLPAGLAGAKADSEARALGGVESICYAPSSIRIYAVFRVERNLRRRGLKRDFRNGVVASRGDAAVHGSAGGGGGGGDMTSAALETVQNADGNGDDVGSGDGDDGDDSEGWKIVEETEMTCPNWLILQFSERQHKAAHEKMLDAIVHQAQKSADVLDGNGS